MSDDNKTDSPGFEELMDFPAEVRLRAVGDQSEALSARCAAAVIGVRPDGLVAMDEKPSSKGKYLSVRLTVVAASADQLRTYYAALHAVDDVRIVF